MLTSSQFITNAQLMILISSLLVLQCWHLMINICCSQIMLHYPLSLHYYILYNTNVSLLINLCGSQIKPTTALCYVTLCFYFAHLSTKCQGFPSHSLEVFVSLFPHHNMVKKYKNLMFTFSDWNFTLPVENSPKLPMGSDFTEISQLDKNSLEFTATLQFTWIHCISAKQLWSAVINSNLTFCLSSTYISSECLFKSTKQADRGMKLKLVFEVSLIIDIQ